MRVPDCCSISDNTSTIIPSTSVNTSSKAQQESSYTPNPLTFPNTKIKLIRSYTFPKSKMYSIATTTMSLFAVLSCIPAISAVPTSALKRDSTFNDGRGDIPNSQFSMILSEDSVAWEGEVYNFTIYTAAGQTSPSNFNGNSEKWQTLSSPYLPNGWTVDIDLKNSALINYADQHFDVVKDSRCSTWSHASAGSDTTYYRCLCDLIPQ